MAVGLSAAEANSILDHLCDNTAQGASTTDVFVQLHIGDPGAAGTTNPAVETTRQQATFGTSASGGAISNTAQLQWTNVAASEDYTHFSVWTLVTGGAFKFSGTVTANAVTANDTFTVPVGDFDVSLPIAA